MTEEKFNEAKTLLHDIEVSEFYLSGLKVPIDSITFNRLDVKIGIDKTDENWVLIENFQKAIIQLQELKIKELKEQFNKL